MDVIPLPTSTDGTPTVPTAACAGCGAPLAPDQRYCLACGRPASPVRLAFLDVLQADRSRETPAFGEHPRFGQQTAATTILGAPSAAGYQPPPDPPGMLGSLRRYSGLFGLLGVLLASLLIGLLVGHWLTGSPGTGKQVVEVKGLGGVPLAAAGAANSSGGAGASTGSGAGSSSSSSSSSSHHSSSNSSQSHNASKSEGGISETSSEEAQAAKEVKSTKALPAAHKTSSATLQKLEHTTGKQHAKEVKAALGNGPIETH
jgi:predicted lipid-binding transport protein (Tim44 family)